MVALQMAMQQQSQARAAAKSAYANKEADVVEAKMNFTIAEDAYKVALKTVEVPQIIYEERVVRPAHRVSRGREAGART